jgi:hypothetical protein
MTDDTGRVIAHGHGDYVQSGPMATGVPGRSVTPAFGVDVASRDDR